MNKHIKERTAIDFDILHTINDRVVSVFKEVHKCKPKVFSEWTDTTYENKPTNHMARVSLHGPDNISIYFKNIIPQMLCDVDVTVLIMSEVVRNYHSCKNLGKKEKLNVDMLSLYTDFYIGSNDVEQDAMSQILKLNMFHSHVFMQGRFKELFNVAQVFYNSSYVIRKKVYDNLDTLKKAYRLHTPYHMPITRPHFGPNNNDGVKLVSQLTDKLLLNYRELGIFVKYVWMLKAFSHRIKSHNGSLNKKLNNSLPSDFINKLDTFESTMVKKSTIARFEQDIRLINMLREKKWEEKPVSVNF